MRGVTAIAFAAAVAVCTVPASAQSFVADPIYDSPLFNFEGFYAGVQAGGALLSGPGIVGVAGVVAGANFSLTDSLLAGLEFQGEGIFNGSSYLGWNALLLGRVGSYLTQDIMAYGALGIGVVNSAGSYALGGGVEMPLMDQLSGRVELLGSGNWGTLPSEAKLTGGVLWHLN